MHTTLRVTARECVSACVDLECAHCVCTSVHAHSLALRKHMLTHKTNTDAVADTHATQTFTS